MHSGQVVEVCTHTHSVCTMPDSAACSRHEDNTVNTQPQLCCHTTPRPHLDVGAEQGQVPRAGQGIKLYVELQCVHHIGVQGLHGNEGCGVRRVPTGATVAGLGACNVLVGAVEAAGDLHGMGSTQDPTSPSHTHTHHDRKQSYQCECARSVQVKETCNLVVLPQTAHSLQTGNIVDGAMITLIGVLKLVYCSKMTMCRLCRLKQCTAIREQWSQGCQHCWREEP